MQIKKQYIAVIVVFLVLILDQASKIWIKTNMVLGESIPVFDNWFIIHFTENYGMAFGLQFAGEVGKVILSLFRILAAIFIAWYLHKLILKNSSKLMIISISLILAGALGNIIDSTFYGLLFSESYYTTAKFLPEGGGYASLLHGKVVDMLYFPVINTTLPEWVPFKGGERFIFFRPVFNIADAAVTVGVFILLIFQKQFFKTSEEKKDNTADNQQTT